MAISVVSFSFSWCSTGGPGAQLSADFLYHILSPTHLISSRGPLLLGGGLSLPHLVSNSSDLQLWLPISPSYIIVQLRTQYLPMTGHRDVSFPPSLEWHVWSSSSGNNCHGVQRSLSSSASVYECTMGFLPCPILSAKSAYAISSHNYHRNVSLHSGASLWNGMFGRVEGPYTTQWR